MLTANHRNCLADFIRMEFFKRTLMHHRNVHELGRQPWKTRRTKTDFGSWSRARGHRGAPPMWMDLVARIDAGPGLQGPSSVSLSLLWKLRLLSLLLAWTLHTSASLGTRPR